MKIVLIQDEIETAIETYISGQGFNLDNKHMEVDLTAGRGSSGFTATIDITPSVEVGSEAPVKSEKVSQPMVDDINELDDDQSLFSKPVADVEATA